MRKLGLECAQNMIYYLEIIKLHIHTLLSSGLGLGYVSSLILSIASQSWRWEDEKV